MFQPLFATQSYVGQAQPVLDLQADTLTLNPGDPVSTWPDQSIFGNNFTQTGADRPTYQVVGGYPTVTFNLSWMIGPVTDTIINGAPSFTIFAVCKTINYDYLITRITDVNGPGFVYTDGSGYVQTDGGNYLDVTNDGTITIPHVDTFELSNFSTLHYYHNGSLDTEAHYDTGTLTGYVVSERVRLGGLGPYVNDPLHPEYYRMTGNLYALRIYSPVLSAARRNAIQQTLARRYGITL